MCPMRPMLSGRGRRDEAKRGSITITRTTRLRSGYGGQGTSTMENAVVGRLVVVPGSGMAIMPGRSDQCGGLREIVSLCAHWERLSRNAENRQTAMSVSEKTGYTLPDRVESANRGCAIRRDQANCGCWRQFSRLEKATDSREFGPQFSRPSVGSGADAAPYLSFAGRGRRGAALGVDFASARSRGILTRGGAG